MKSSPGEARAERSPAKAGSRRSAVVRVALGALVVAAMAPVGLRLGSATDATRGCAAPFDSVSKVNTLRVLAVTLDKPYAQPGETVKFHMAYRDGAPEGPRPVTIAWLAGCQNPEADQYYGCYSQLQDPSLVQTGAGPDFEMTIPDNIISQRPVPSVGPHYGIAYIFFLACAGTLAQVDDKGGQAGSFPLGCFDTAGNRLGPDGFVPGYTQVYSFADGRTNRNPEIKALTLNQTPIDPLDTPKVERCALTDDERRVQGCGKQDPFATCTQYGIDIDIDAGVADEDPDAVNPDGTTLRETVWVDYFSDKGDFDSDIKLVSDASSGYNADHGTHWIPPDEPGFATIWAVVHDTRGGESVIERLVEVK